MGKSVSACKEMAFLGLFGLCVCFSLHCLYTFCVKKCINVLYVYFVYYFCEEFHEKGMIMLQANELMVGDSVLYTEFGKNEIDTIETIGPRRVWLEHGRTCIPFEYISPIPLSRFVLERLGFDVSVIPDYDDVEEEVFYKAVCRCKDNRGCDVEIEYRTDRNEIHVISHDCKNILPIRQVWTQIRFVHELRHLFVLFGIEKEIAL